MLKTNDIHYFTERYAKNNLRISYFKFVSEIRKFVSNSINSPSLSKRKLLLKAFLKTKSDFIGQKDEFVKQKKFFSKFIYLKFTHFSVLYREVLKNNSPQNEKKIAALTIKKKINV